MELFCRIVSAAILAAMTVANAADAVTNPDVRERRSNAWAVCLLLLLWLALWGAGTWN